MKHTVETKTTTAVTGVTLTMSVEEFKLLRDTIGSYPLPTLFGPEQKRRDAICTLHDNLWNVKLS